MLHQERAILWGCCRPRLPPPSTCHFHRVHMPSIQLSRPAQSINIIISLRSSRRISLCRRSRSRCRRRSRLISNTTTTSSRPQFRFRILRGCGPRGSALYPALLPSPPVSADVDESREYCGNSYHARCDADACRCPC